jgi:hypothetical protein
VPSKDNVLFIKSDINTPLYDLIISSVIVDDGDGVDGVDGVGAPAPSA